MTLVETRKSQWPPPLNTKFVIQSPSIIDEENRKTIKTLLSQYHLFLPDDFNWEWVNKEGKIFGRIGKCFKGNFSLKIYDRLSALFSNITLNKEYLVDFTDRFDWRRGDFGDHGSCFWTSKRTDKTFLQRYKALAFRLWKDETRGFARAWVVQMDNDPLSLAVFNGYGLELNKMTYLLASYYEMYHKQVLINAPVYINSGALLSTKKENDIESISLRDVMKQCRTCLKPSLLFHTNVCSSCQEQFQNRYCTVCYHRYKRVLKYRINGKVLCSSCRNKL